MRSALAAEYRLRDASGALVPLSTSLVGTRLDLRPSAPLAPRSRYTLEQVVAYDAAGVRISDEERMLAAARGRLPRLRGVWFAVASFETARGPAAQRALSVALGRRELARARGGPDCGPGVSFGAELQISGPVRPTDVLELRIDGVGVAETLPAIGPRVMGASDLSCDPDRVRLPTRAVRFRIVVIDAAGRELGATTAAREAARGWFPLTAAWRARRRPAETTVSMRAAARWSTTIATISERSPAAPAPSACPNGLEIAAQTEMANVERQAWLGAQSSLASDGQNAWMPVGARDGEFARLVRIGGDGSLTPRPTRMVGDPAAVWNDRSGVYVVAYRGRHVTVYALDHGGQTRWARRISTRPTDAVRLASGRGRLLVSWAHRTPPWARLVVAWTIFDERTGTLIGRTTATRYPIGEPTTLGSAFVRDRFLVAFPSRNTLELIAISLDGIEIAHRDLRIGAASSLDLVGADAGAGLVAELDGDIAWYLLDASGRVVRGPVQVSAGIGLHYHRAPRIAFNGELFSVAWLDDSSRNVYATVIDRAGRAAAAQALERSRVATTPGIASVGREFVASHVTFGARVQTTLSALRCRSTPRRTAPARIASDTLHSRIVRTEQ